MSKIENTEEEHNSMKRLRDTKEMNNSTDNLENKRGFTG